MSNIAGSTVPVQLESLQTGNPVSESALVAMGATANQGLLNSAQIGDIVSSMLILFQFQGLRDTTWVLADGSSCLGSDYANLTGFTTLPDLRAVFLRGKDNTRGLNPYGDLPLGTYTPDGLIAHTHEYQAPNGGSGGGSASGTSGQAPLTTTVAQNPAGAAETSPKSVTVNFFIKINT